MERHGKYYFSAKDIFEQEFGREVRGYSKVEVDEFLTMSSRTMKLMLPWSNPSVKKLLDLKEELARKPQVAPVQADPIEVTSFKFYDKFDILKRLNRLEKKYLVNKS